jgi:hypothetical protein
LKQEGDAIKQTRISGWRIADSGVLALWLAVAGFTLAHHEKWSDEAQAWLLAKQLSLPTLWLKELRYEGSPGLWHTILWFAQHWFHLPYSSIGVIGLVFATAGAAFLLFKAPFPRPLRWLLAFSYFLLYQYAVIARQYTMMPLFAFAAAYFFRDVRRPERITIALILLANTASHGALLAALIGFFFAIELWLRRAEIDTATRRRIVYCAVALVLTYAWLIVVLKSPLDSDRLQASRHMPANVVWFYFQNAVGGTFFDDFTWSAVFLLAMAIWFLARKRLPLYVLAMAGMTGLYTATRGWPHHQGTIFVAFITVLWIAWPSNDEHAFARSALHRTAVCALAGLFAFQVWTSAIAITHEIRLPFTGAEDCARYLKSVGAGHQGVVVFGYFYSRVAVQAHFEHNIFANTTTEYFHHAMEGTVFAVPPHDLDAKPDYVVIPLWNDARQQYRRDYEKLLAERGYSLVHLSDGRIIDKRGLVEREAYLVYRRPR